MGKGVYLDDMGGHVDNHWCFVRPVVIAFIWTEEPSDPQYETSLGVYERLKSITDGELEIHKIHQPNPFRMTEEKSKGVDIVADTISRQSGDHMTGSSIILFILPTEVL